MFFDALLPIVYPLVVLVCVMANVGMIRVIR